MLPELFRRRAALRVGGTQSAYTIYNEIVAELSKDGRNYNVHLEQPETPSGNKELGAYHRLVITDPTAGYTGQKALIIDFRVGPTTASGGASIFVKSRGAIDSSSELVIGAKVVGQQDRNANNYNYRLDKPSKNLSDLVRASFEAAEDSRSMGYEDRSPSDEAYGIMNVETSPRYQRLRDKHKIPRGFQRLWSTPSPGEQLKQSQNVQLYLPTDNTEDEFDRIGNWMIGNKSMMGLLEAGVFVPRRVASGVYALSRIADSVVNTTSAGLTVAKALMFRGMVNDKIVEGEVMKHLKLSSLLGSARSPVMYPYKIVKKEVRTPSGEIKKIAEWQLMDARDVQEYQQGRSHRYGEHLQTSSDYITLGGSYPGEHVRRPARVNLGLIANMPTAGGSGLTSPDIYKGISGWAYQADVPAIELPFATPKALDPEQAADLYEGRSLAEVFGLRENLIGKTIQAGGSRPFFLGKSKAPSGEVPYMLPAKQYQRHIEGITIILPQYMNAGGTKFFGSLEAAKEAKEEVISTNALARSIESELGRYGVRVESSGKDIFPFMQVHALGRLNVGSKGFGLKEGEEPYTGSRPLGINVGGRQIRLGSINPEVKVPLEQFAASFLAQPRANQLRMLGMVDKQLARSALENYNKVFIPGVDQDILNPSQEATYYAIDFETTKMHRGGTPQPLSFGITAYKWDPVAGKHVEVEGSAIESLVLPSGNLRELLNEYIKVPDKGRVTIGQHTSLTEEDFAPGSGKQVMSYDEASRVITEILNGPGKKYIVGHGAHNFDIPKVLDAMLSSQGAKLGGDTELIDTLALAKQAGVVRGERGLSKVIGALGIPAVGVAHTALADARSAMSLVAPLVNKIKEKYGVVDAEGSKTGMDLEYLGEEYARLKGEPDKKHYLYLMADIYDKFMQANEQRNEENLRRFGTGYVADATAHGNAVHPTVFKMHAAMARKILRLDKSVDDVEVLARGGVTATLNPETGMYDYDFKVKTGFIMPVVRWAAGDFPGGSKALNFEIAQAMSKLKKFAKAYSIDYLGGPAGKKDSKERQAWQNITMAYQYNLDTVMGTPVEPPDDRWRRVDAMDADELSRLDSMKAPVAGTNTEEAVMKELMEQIGDKGIYFEESHRYLPSPTAIFNIDRIQRVKHPGTSQAHYITLYINALRELLEAEKTGNFSNLSAHARLMGGSESKFGEILTGGKDILRHMYGRQIPGVSTGTYQNLDVLGKGEAYLDPEEIDRLGRNMGLKTREELEMLRNRVEQGGVKATFWRYPTLSRETAIQAVELQTTNAMNKRGFKSSLFKSQSVGQIYINPFTGEVVIGDKDKDPAGWAIGLVPIWDKNDEGERVLKGFDDVFEGDEVWKKMKSKNEQHQLEMLIGKANYEKYSTVFRGWKDYIEGQSPMSTVKGFGLVPLDQVNKIARDYRNILARRGTSHLTLSAMSISAATMGLTEEELEKTMRGTSLLYQQTLEVNKEASISSPLELMSNTSVFRMKKGRMELATAWMYDQEKAEPLFAPPWHEGLAPRDFMENLIDYTTKGMDELSSTSLAYGLAAPGKDRAEFMQNVAAIKAALREAGDDRNAWFNVLTGRSAGTTDLMGSGVISEEGILGTMYTALTVGRTMRKIFREGKNETDQKQIEALRGAINKEFFPRGDKTMSLQQLYDDPRIFSFLKLFGMRTSREQRPGEGTMPSATEIEAIVKALPKNAFDYGWGQITKGVANWLNIEKAKRIPQTIPGGLTEERFSEEILKGPTEFRASGLASILSGDPETGLMAIEPAAARYALGSKLAITAKWIGGLTNVEAFKRYEDNQVMDEAGQRLTELGNQYERTIQYWGTPETRSDRGLSSKNLMLLNREAKRIYAEIGGKKISGILDQLALQQNDAFFGGKEFLHIQELKFGGSRSRQAGFQALIYRDILKWMASNRPDELREALKDWQGKITSEYRAVRYKGPMVDQKEVQASDVDWVDRTLDAIKGDRIVSSVGTGMGNEEFSQGGLAQYSMMDNPSEEDYERLGGLQGAMELTSKNIVSHFKELTAQLINLYQHGSMSSVSELDPYGYSARIAVKPGGVPLGTLNILRSKIVQRWTGQGLAKAHIGTGKMSARGEAVEILKDENVTAHNKPIMIIPPGGSVSVSQGVTEETTNPRLRNMDTSGHKESEDDAPVLGGGVVAVPTGMLVETRPNPALAGAGGTGGDGPKGPGKTAAPAADPDPKKDKGEPAQRAVAGRATWTFPQEAVAQVTKGVIAYQSLTKSGEIEAYVREITRFVEEHPELGTPEWQAQVEKGTLAQKTMASAGVMVGAAGAGLGEELGKRLQPHVIAINKFKTAIQGVAKWTEFSSAKGAAILKGSPDVISAYDEMVADVAGKEGAESAVGRAAATAGAAQGLGTGVAGVSGELQKLSSKVLPEFNRQITEAGQRFKETIDNIKTSGGEAALEYDRAAKQYKAERQRALSQGIQGTISTKKYAGTAFGEVTPEQFATLSPSDQARYAQDLSNYQDAEAKRIAAEADLQAAPLPERKQGLAGRAGRIARGIFGGFGWFFLQRAAQMGMGQLTQGYEEAEQQEAHRELLAAQYNGPIPGGFSAGGAFYARQRAIARQGSLGLGSLTYGITNAMTGTPLGDLAGAGKTGFGVGLAGTFLGSELAGAAGLSGAALGAIWGLAVPAAALGVMGALQYSYTKNPEESINTGAGWAVANRMREAQGMSVPWYARKAETWYTQGLSLKDIGANRWEYLGVDASRFTPQQRQQALESAGFVPGHRAPTEGSGFVTYTQMEQTKQEELISGYYKGTLSRNQLTPELYNTISQTLSKTPPPGLENYPIEILQQATAIMASGRVQGEGQQKHIANLLMTGIDISQAQNAMYGLGVMPSQDMLSTIATNTPELPWVARQQIMGLQAMSALSPAGRAAAGIPRTTSALMGMSAQYAEYAARPEYNKWLQYQEMRGSQAIAGRPVSQDITLEDLFGSETRGEDFAQRRSAGRVKSVSGKRREELIRQIDEGLLMDNWESGQRQQLTLAGYGAAQRADIVGMQRGWMAQGPQAMEWSPQSMAMFTNAQKYGASFQQSTTIANAVQSFAAAGQYGNINMMQGVYQGNPEAVARQRMQQFQAGTLQTPWGLPSTNMADVMYQGGNRLPVDITVGGQVTGRPMYSSSFPLGDMARAMGGMQAAQGSWLYKTMYTNGQETGYTPLMGNKPLFGMAGAQMAISDLSYQSQMASIGTAQAQIALTRQYYLGGGQFGGGMWALQDKQRALGWEQTQWGFGQQRAQLALQSSQFGEQMGMQWRQMQMQQGFAKQDWAAQDQVRAMQWGWRQEDFQEQVRFMSGRERRLAERQMRRDTIMHGVEGDNIDRQRDQQKEMWRLQEEQWRMQQKHFSENKKFQEDAIKKQEEFFERRKKLEIQMEEMQRAYTLAQLDLQEAQIGAAASFAAQIHEAETNMALMGEDQKIINDAWQTYTTYGDYMVSVFQQIYDWVVKIGAVAGAGAPPATPPGGGGGGGGGGGTPDLKPHTYAGSGTEPCWACGRSKGDPIHTNNTKGNTSSPNPWAGTYIPTGNGQGGANGQQVVLTVNIGNDKLGTYVLDTITKELKVV